MEVSKRAAGVMGGASEGSPRQMKLSETYRTVKKNSVFGEKKQDFFGCKEEVGGGGGVAQAVYLAPGRSANVKQEENVEAGHLSFMSNSMLSSSLPPLGVQTGYNTFPGVPRREQPSSLGFKANNKVVPMPSIVFGNVKAEPVDHLPLFCSPALAGILKLGKGSKPNPPPVVPKANPALSVNLKHHVGAEQTDRMPEVAPFSSPHGLPVPSVKLERMDHQQQESVAPPPPVVMVVEDDSVPGNGADTTTTTVAAAAAAAAAMGGVKGLGYVKVEPVEKLFTALDMFPGGGDLDASSNPLPFALPKELPPLAVVVVKEENHPVGEAPPIPNNKLMTALDMFPAEELGHQELHHHHHHLRGGLSSPNLMMSSDTLSDDASESLNGIIRRVKSEPEAGVGGSGEKATTSGSSFEKNKNTNKVSEIIQNAVTRAECPPIRTENYQSGVFTDRTAFQPAPPPQVVSGEESDEYSSSSTESDDTDDEDELVLSKKGRKDGTNEAIERSLQQKRQRHQEDVEKKHRNSNPGRRVQGGRLYDSSFGITCHWCRQKTVEPHVKCRECTIHYCGPCLLNRNGENIKEELCDGVRWLCPKCRNGCGPGCDNCCNCGPCRKADGKTPTGQLVGTARSAGFMNAHDYLVHLQTGETPAVIARRKEGRDWTNCGRFECEVGSDASEGGVSSSEEGEEFTLNAETSTQLHGGKLGMKHVRRLVEQSQKRKRGGMRGALPPKSIPHQAPSSSARVNDIFAKLKNPLKRSSPSVPSKRDEAHITPKPEPMEEDYAGEKLMQDRVSNGSVIKREWEEIDGHQVGVSNMEFRPPKRMKRGGAESGYHSGVQGSVGVGCANQEPNVKKSDCGIAASTSPGSTSLNASAELTELVDRVARRGQELPSGLDSELILKTRGVSVLRGPKGGLSNHRSQMAPEHRVMESPGDSQGDEYRMKLKCALAEAFDEKELQELSELAECRKPLQRMRQMRGRVVDVVTTAEGLSYMDHHQDFAARLAEAVCASEKLALLRGFFFWLQHSCMEGAFRPWSPQAEPKAQSGDCIETDGPECQVTAVVVQLDEGKEVFRQKRKYRKKSPQIEKSFGELLRGEGGPEAFVVVSGKHQPVKSRVRKQSNTQAESNYRVVLCLPAPALCKV